MSDGRSPGRDGSPQVPHGARRHRWRRAGAVRAAPPSRVEKLVPYLVQSEDQIPGVRDLVRQHLHRVRGRLRRARAHPRGARGQAGGQSRAPGQPGQAVLPRPGGAPGALQPGPHQGADGRGSPTGTFGEITWDDAIAPAGRRSSARPAGKVAVLSGAGRGNASPTSSPSGPRALGGKAGPLGAVRPRADAGGEPPGVRPGPAPGARLRQGASTSSPSAPTSWRPGSRPSRTSAASPRRTDSPTATWPSSSTPAPRRDLTGLNADEWLPIRPGTETALALAMANVVATASGAPAGVAQALAKFTPAAAAQETGMPAERIERLAREFAAAKPSLAVAGGVGAQHAGATELCAAVNLLNFVAGNVGQTVRFGADLAAADGYAALAQLARGDGRRPGGGAAGARRQPGLRPAQGRGLRRQAQEGALQGLDRRSSSTRPPPSATCCCPQHHALERWDDLAPRAGVRSLMQPVMEPVFDTRSAGDILLRVAKKAGGALAKFTDADAGRPTSGAAGRRSRPSAKASRRRTTSGARRCSAAASSTSRRRRRRSRSRASAADIALHQAGVRGQGRASCFLAYPHAHAARRPRAPTSRGCSRTPTRSPRSPGTPGSR